MLLAGTASAAPAPDRRAFELAQANGWPDALAICDLTRFLVSRPDLDADVILARDDATGWMRPLYGPRFMPPTLFFDHALRLAFDRLERAGEIDRRSFSLARARHDRAMLHSFRRGSQSDLRFLEAQSRLCGAFAADIRARYP